MVAELHGIWFSWLLNTPEAAMAAGVFFEGFEELRFAEIRPEGLGHDQFGVGNLPKQKIADSHLAAGSDEQVRIGHVLGVKVLGDDFLVDFGGIEFALPNLIGNPADGLDNFSASSVAEGENQC